MNAPAYKLAKCSTHLLRSMIELPYMFNVTNAARLINDMNDINVDINSRLASFDITNIYANIPTGELRTIIKTH